MNTIDQKLVGIFSLSFNVKIYVPSTTEVNKEGTNLQKYFVNKGLSLFSGYFGGSTAHRAVGAWNSDKLGLVTEKITILESYCSPESLENNIESVLNFAREIKSEMKQEAVSLEINSKLYLV